MRLSLVGIDVSYGHFRAMSGVTLDVEAGDLLGITGPNGSGKTTFLRTVARVLTPSAGAVFLDSTAIAKLRIRELARLIASVPQKSEANFDFTAHDIVLMGRFSRQDRFEGVKREDSEAVNRAMKSTGSDHLQDRIFGTLSGGEQQRVLIARGLAQQPKILLLDEPTSHLDLSGQVEILSLIRRICMEEGLTVIAVLHDLNLVARFADRLVLMNRGRIERVGSPIDVLTPETLEQTYGCKVQVFHLSGVPHVVVVPGV